MSNWFGGVAGGRDSAFHVEYDTSLGGLTLSHNASFDLSTEIVQVIDWGDGSPLEVWDTNAIGYDWTTYSLYHTYATSGTYRVKTWWVPKDSTQNPSSNIYGYTFGHPREGKPDWMGNSTPYNSRIGITEIVNFGPSSPSGLFEDYRSHENLSMTYLQDGIKEDNDTRYWAYRWASGCKLKNTYNPKVWAMFDTRKLTRMWAFFSNYPNRNSGLLFNPDVTMWDVSNVTLFNEMFTDLGGFDRDLSNWDVSSGTNFYNFFARTDSFNNGGSSGINNWDTSNVTNMSSMFNTAKSFNQPIGNWNVSNVTTFSFMFNNADGFNQPIGSWDVSSSTSFYQMFRSNGGFGVANASGEGTNPLTNWTLYSGPGTIDMRFMFFQSEFNSDISNWNVSRVLNMQRFAQTSPFNNGNTGDMSAWTFDSCINFEVCFYGSQFNQPIGNWTFHPSSNIDMSDMFRYASQFNQDISNWDVSQVTDMTLMLADCGFDQDLGPWGDHLNASVNMTDMLSNNDMSTENYSRTLIGFANYVFDNSGPFNRVFGAASLTYHGSTGTTYGGYGTEEFVDAVNARAYLTGTGGWTITDGGSV